MEQQKLEPDGKTYGSLLRACFLGGYNERALDIIARMRREGIEPNRFAYHDAVQCCANLQKVDEAIKLYRNMVSQNIVPLKSTFAILTTETVKHGMHAMVAELRQHNNRVKRDTTSTDHNSQDNDVDEDGE